MKTTRSIFVIDHSKQSLCNEQDTCHSHFLSTARMRLSTPLESLRWCCHGVASRHVSLSMWHVTIPKYRTFLDWIRGTRSRRALVTMFAVQTSGMHCACVHTKCRHALRMRSHELESDARFCCKSPPPPPPKKKEIKPGIYLPAELTAMSPEIAFPAVCDELKPLAESMDTPSCFAMWLTSADHFDKN